MKILASLLMVFLLAINTASANKEYSVESKSNLRIISLAPSITEIVCELGATDKLVGRSRYCLYPPEITRIPEVGGYLDPSIEAILMLRADLIIMTSENSRLAETLIDLGLHIEMVSHNSLEEVLNSIPKIATFLNLPAAGRILESQLREQINCVKKYTENLPKPRVALIVGRNPDPGPPAGIYAIAQGSWLNDLLNFAGGQNVFSESSVALPALSAESFIVYDPQFIIEIHASTQSMPGSAESLLEDWQNLQLLQAVKNNKVKILSGSELVIPGPRITKALQKLASVIHPEIDWGHVCYPAMGEELEH
jgi:iron complex transport system substrate-binding protein